MAVLHADVEALRIIARRNKGEPITTPTVPPILSTIEIEPDGKTLRAALEGWKCERQRSPRTETEYQRAIDLFVELHGDLPVVQIKRSHARSFRDALRQVPRHRTKGLAHLTLPQTIEWANEHPDASRVSAATVNKQLGGVQSTLAWAHNEGGFIPDDVEWGQSLRTLAAEENEPDREPFDLADFRHSSALLCSLRERMAESGS